VSSASIRHALHPSYRFENIRANGPNVIPPKRQGQRSHRAQSVADATGLVPDQRNQLLSCRAPAPGIHVHRRDIAPMRNLPLGQNLNQGCAIVVAAASVRNGAQSTVLGHTCYSFIAPDESRLDCRVLLRNEGASFTNMRCGWSLARWVRRLTFARPKRNRRNAWVRGITRGLR